MYIALALAVGYFIGRYIRWTHRDDWRADAPTERQIDYARDLGIRVPKGCTKGQLSELIDAARAGR